MLLAFRFKGQTIASFSGRWKTLQIILNMTLNGVYTCIGHFKQTSAVIGVCEIVPIANICEMNVTIIVLGRIRCSVCP